MGRALPLKSQTVNPPFSVCGGPARLDCKDLLPKCQYTLTNGKGVKNHEKTTQVESLLLKIVSKIDKMFFQIDKMVFHIFKLKKEVLDL